MITTCAKGEGKHREEISLLRGPRKVLDGMCSSPTHTASVED